MDCLRFSHLVWYIFILNPEVIFPFSVCHYMPAAATSMSYTHATRWTISWSRNQPFCPQQYSPFQAIVCGSRVWCGWRVHSGKRLQQARLLQSLPCSRQGGAIGIDYISKHKKGREGFLLEVIASVGGSLIIQRKLSHLPSLLLIMINLFSSTKELGT